MLTEACLPSSHAHFGCKDGVAKVDSISTPFSQASTAPPTPGKLLLPDPYHELPADGCLPFARMLSSASTQEPLLEEEILGSPCSTPTLKASELGKQDVELREPELASELGRWARVAVEAEESSTHPGSEHERSSESSEGAEEFAAPGIFECRALRSELGRWAQAEAEAEQALAEQKQAAPGVGRAGGSARRRRPRRRGQRRQRRSDGGVQVPPQMRPLRSPLGRFAEALCSGGPALQSELGRWAQALVLAEEEEEALSRGGPLLKSELGCWAEAAVRAEEAVEGLRAVYPTPQSELGLWAEREVEEEEKAEAFCASCPELRSELGRCAEKAVRTEEVEEALRAGRPALKSELGRWAEAAMWEEEAATEATVTRACAVGVDGVAYGVDAIQPLTASEGSARANRLKLFHRKRQARQAHASEEEAGKRWFASQDGALQEAAAPRRLGLNFGAVLRLKQRLAARRARAGPSEWEGCLLAADAEGAVRGFRPLTL